MYMTQIEQLVVLQKVDDEIVTLQEELNKAPLQITELEKRRQTGLWWMGFLLFTTVLAYMAYRNVWADKKGH